VGAPIAAAIAADIGLSASDEGVVRDIVRWHLLLPEVATRRDLDDPAIIADVAAKVKSVATLEILHMLARADAAATGPLAWSDWKGRLIDQLVVHVKATLGGSAPAARTDPSPALVSGPLPVIQVADDWVALAAPDRTGLLAAVAGCLAAHRLEIVAVNSVTLADRAVIECAVTSRFGAVPARDLLASDLRRVALGSYDVSPRLAAGARRPAAAAARVLWAAPDLLELRAADAPGLLYRVTSVLASLDVDVRLARVSTLGADVVDAFYLTGSFDADDVEKAVLAAAA
jgi:[protein-PII] uridylyltransferase